MKTNLVWFSVLFGCSIAITSALVCPPGFKISAISCPNAEPCCVPVNRSQPIVQPTICQYGYIAGSNGQCIHNSQIVQPAVCQQGYIATSSGQCVHNSQIIQPTICQQGYIATSSGQCVHNSQIIQPTICQQGCTQQQSTICQQGISRCAQQIQPVPCTPSVTPCVQPTLPPIRPTIYTTTATTTTSRPTDHMYERTQEVSKAVAGDTSVTISLTNVIYTNNTIHAPVNITNHNVVNTPVHISDSSNIERNGNESCQNIPESKEDGGPQPCPRPPPNPRQPKCCTIISPRICRTVNNEWKCTHKKYNRCGSFCVAPKIYLRTHTMRYRDSRLIVPPLRTRPHHVPRGPTRTDCSGCMSGQSQRCSQDCFTYDCSRSRGCHFQDQDQFCNEYGGDGCTEEDGYQEPNISGEYLESDLEYPIN